MTIEKIKKLLPGDWERMDNCLFGTTYITCKPDREQQHKKSLCGIAYVVQVTC